MELEEDAGWMELLKKVSLQMVNHTGTAAKYSKMEAILKEYGKMAGVMDKENM